MQMSNQIAGILCLLAGLVSGGFLIWSLIRQNAIRKWPVVEGKIIDSRVNVLSGDSFEPYVRYSYVVNGQSYTGDKLAPVDYITEDERSANKRIEPYMVGNSVTIFYHPEKMSQSVIEPRNSSWYHLFWAFFTAFMLFVGVGLFFQQS